MAEDTITWYVPNYHDELEPKETPLKGWHDGQSAVKALAKAHWHRDGDCCLEFEIVIVAPKKWAGQYAIAVESEPVFYARKQEKVGG